MSWTVLVFVGVEGEVDGVFLVVADNCELDGVARGEFANEGREGAGAADFDAVNFRDDVASFEASFFGGAAGGDGVLAGGRVEIGAARDG